MIGKYGCVNFILVSSALWLCSGGFQIWEIKIVFQNYIRNFFRRFKY